MKKIAVFICIASTLIACNKEEGPGGTSSIEGTVTGREFEPARAEITEVIFTAGSELEHGDYWILNTPIGGTYYYIWYDNPTWISDGDPYLEGRTGIAVEFNYSDSNIDIATNTSTALSSIAGSDFSISLQNDVMILTNKKSGYVPDANKVTTNFELNIGDQGQDEYYGSESPLSDIEVYILYGDDTVYGDQTRTGGDGEYRFTNLVKGTYSVYVVSQDTVNPEGFVKSGVTVKIDENKSVVTAGNLNLLY
ncbi:MAG: hypothetical protein IPO32_09370 [Crocinitomicaceae bacterium]|nr:hypothetical protein [Crocinitomicaceae bacterium]MBK6952327.1 hypothetical protein [Crocinitomicaceae bacterium]MBK9591694.1 hypothetical protein [Crocinitomicaceae bacterium]